MSTQRGYTRVGKITPWASAMLTSEECGLVYRSPIRFLGGSTSRGPWTAKGPAGDFHDQRDIRTAVNLAAGEELLKGERNG